MQCQPLMQVSLTQLFQLYLIRRIYYNFIIYFLCLSNLDKNRNKTTRALKFLAYGCVCAVISGNPWHLDKILPNLRNVVMHLALPCVTTQWHTHIHCQGRRIREQRMSALHPMRASVDLMASQFELLIVQN